MYVNNNNKEKHTHIAKDIKVLNQVIFPETEGDKIHLYFMEMISSP